MTSGEQQEAEIKKSRDAFALLCRLIYKEFGKNTLPVIEGVCFKLGTADGKRMRNNLSNSCFKSVCEMFNESARKHGLYPEVIELSEKKRHTKFYCPCPLGLENNGRELCEAMMALDWGLFEAAMEGKVNLKILKTLAAGDPYCEVMWTPVD